MTGRYNLLSYRGRHIICGKDLLVFRFHYIPRGTNVVLHFDLVRGFAGLHGQVVSPLLSRQAGAVHNLLTFGVETISRMHRAVRRPRVICGSVRDIVFSE